jgi:hypothetical protein
VSLANVAIRRDLDSAPACAPASGDLNSYKIVATHEKSSPRQNSSPGACKSGTDPDPAGICSVTKCALESAQTVTYVTVDRDAAGADTR